MKRIPELVEDATKRLPRLKRTAPELFPEYQDVLITARALRKAHNDYVEARERWRKTAQGRAYDPR